MRFETEKPTWKCNVVCFAAEILFVLLMGLCRGGVLYAQSSPSIVQVTQNETSTGRTVSAQFNAAATAGNTIIAYVVWSNSSTVSVTDSSGDTFVSVSPRTSWQNRYSAQVFFATNIAGGATTVTAHFRNYLSTSGALYIHEYAGINAANPVDATASARGSSSFMNSGNITTTSANDLIFGAGASDNTVTAAGNGFTAQDLSYGVITEDLIGSAAGSYSATATHNGYQWAMQVVAFRSASGPGPDTTAPTVPTGVSANAVSSSQINLSWTAATDPDNGSSQLDYQVYRNNVLVGTTTPGVTSFSDTGLAASTTYTYNVAAQDPAGNTSAPSASVQATTPGPSMPVITSFNANPSTITNGQNSTLSWNVSYATSVTLDNGIGNVTGTNSTTVSPSATTVYTLTATNSAGSVTAQATVTVSSSGSGASSPFTTNFPTTENPLSQGGNWIDGGTNGLDWSDVWTTPGLAFGTQSGVFMNYNDSVAILTGTWGPDQTVQSTVHSVNQSLNYTEEVELWLRGNISPHSISGYEINFSCTGNFNQGYMQIVRWNGPLNNFTYVDYAGPGINGVNDGDVVKASISGNTITVWVNGVQIGQGTDNTYANGNPGIGFYLQSQTGVNSDYGFTNFTATDGSTADTTPPSVPANLSAVATSPSQLNLSWTASTDNVGVAGYDVFRNGNLLTTTATTAFTDTGLAANTLYSYTVAAVDDAGNVSVQSAPASATTPGPDTTPPSTPTGLKASNVTFSSVTISWTASTDSVAVAGYQIFRNGAQVGTTASTSFTDSGLSPSTTYSYTVAAYDTSNNVSPQSQQLFVTTASGPAVPPSFVQVSGNQIPSGASVSTTFNVAVTPGNTIIAYVIWSNSSTVSVTDSSGDTFVSVSPQTSWWNRYSAQVFYATNVAGGATTVTATFRNAVNFFGTIYIHEYAGISGINPVDATTSASGTSAFMSSGVITTASPNDLVFGAGASDNTVTTVGSGFTARDLVWGNITEDMLGSTPGSYSATATHNGTYWEMQVVAFRAAK